MNTIVSDELQTYVREVIINYRGPKRKAPPITNPHAVSEFLRHCRVDNAREHFIVIFLNHAKSIIGYSVAGIGTQNSCSVNPAELYQKAVLLGAGSIIIAHNHPSGGLEPSQADIAVTKQIKAAGELLGIPLLDHIIFTEECFVSFQEKGLLSVC
ncbi:MAG: JAB domain-containing protein [bacterium]|nr:JAB domain-containing protein [bacterium]